MTWDELTRARNKLNLTVEQMAILLAVGLPTYKGWKTRKNGVPDYIAASVKAHLLLDQGSLQKIMKKRGLID